MSALAQLAGRFPLHIAIALSRMALRAQETILVERCRWRDCQHWWLEIHADERTYRRHLEVLGFWETIRARTPRMRGGVYGYCWTECTCLPF